MNIRVLAENSAEPGFHCEHGLSLLIEHDDNRILLDAGQSDVFEKNSALMGVDLTTMDTAVLSHGHYDHSDGFRRFFSVNSNAMLYMSSSCSDNCYGEKDDGIKYIGVFRELISDYPDRIVRIASVTEILPGVWLLPHSTPGLSERGAASGMLVEKGGHYVHDDFSHEQTLVIEGRRGLCVFSSCSHAGTENIVKEVASAFPDKQAYAFVGGFHLMGPDGPDSLGAAAKNADEMAAAFKAEGYKKIYTGHCTGAPGYALMKEKLGPMLSRLTSGMVFEL